MYVFSDRDQLETMFQEMDKDDSRDINWTEFLQYFAPSVGKAWDPPGGATAGGRKNTSRRKSTAAAAAASGASRHRRASQTASRKTTAGGQGGGEGGDGGRSGRGGGDSSDDVRRLTQVVHQLLSEKAQMTRENELLKANYDKGAH